MLIPVLRHCVPRSIGTSTRISVCNLSRWHTSRSSSSEGARRSSASIPSLSGHLKEISGAVGCHCNPAILLWLLVSWIAPSIVLKSILTTSCTPSVSCFCIHQLSTFLSDSTPILKITRLIIISGNLSIHRFGLQIFAFQHIMSLTCIPYFNSAGSFPPQLAIAIREEKDLCL